MKITDKYVFFWKESPFCNFTKCKIKYNDPYMTDLSTDGITFTSSEQMFMWLKAKYFQDDDIAYLILNTNSPEEARKFGRYIRNYDDKKWDAVRYNYMLMAVTYKFVQNKDLRDILLDSKYDGKTFVEASPYDKIWGIGFDENHAESDESNWGQNLLGTILNVVRKHVTKICEFDVL
jgi:ribA/ribD-fused uncharacterized protein